MKQSGMHAQVNCEACHGPLAKHADDPLRCNLPKLDTAVLVCALPCRQAPPSQRISRR